MERGCGDRAVNCLTGIGSYALESADPGDVNVDAVGTAGEIVGATAVPATLPYLAVQIRECPCPWATAVTDAIQAWYQNLDTYPGSPQLVLGRHGGSGLKGGVDRLVGFGLPDVALTVGTLIVFAASL